MYSTNTWFHRIYAPQGINDAKRIEMKKKEKIEENYYEKEMEKSIKCVVIQSICE